MAVFVTLSGLMNLHTHAQTPPTSLLPPTLGQAQPAPVAPSFGQPVPHAVPAPVLQFNVPAAPQPSLAPGAGSLGTIPAGSLGVIPREALGAVPGAGFDATFALIKAPMPASVLQRAARESLVDRAIVETSDQMARARALYALGFAEDAAGAAIEAVPASVADRALTARTLLAVGQKEQACTRADVESLPKDAEPASTFELLEVLAFCKLDQGSREAGQLIANLLRDQGGGDRLFFAMFEQAGDGEVLLPDVNKVKRVRPIHLTLMLRAGVPITADFVMRADLALLGAIVRSNSTDVAARIAATERQVEAGLVPASTLIRLYETTSLDERLLMQAASGVAPPGPLSRAHLFALVAEAPDLSQRIGLISTLYAQASQAGVGGAVAEAIGEDAAGITPDPSLGSAAALLVEILARADRARAALAWIDAGEFPGVDGRPSLSRFAAHRNRALIAVSDPQLGLGVAAGALGSDTGAASLSPAERDFVKLEVAVMTALGDQVSPVLADIGGRSEVPVMNQSPVGILDALAPLAGADLKTADSSTIATAIGALSGYGLQIEARLLAVEALVARGSV